MPKKSKMIKVFARTKADVKFRFRRAEDNKNYSIKRITKVRQDKFGTNEYNVQLKRRVGR